MTPRTLVFVGAAFISLIGSPSRLENHLIELIDQASQELELFVEEPLDLALRPEDFPPHPLPEVLSTPAYWHI